MVKEIPLTQGLVALVDDEDFDWLMQFKWCAHRVQRGVYAKSRVNGRNEMMHRLIMGLPSSDVDHKDRNKLNNQKSNLRISTRSQNIANSCMKSTNTSGVKGVYWSSSKNKWCAQIRVNGKLKLIGAFPELSAAAAAYERVARESFGEFAFPDSRL